MEEFKNLKEIIELCEEELDKNDENVHATLDLEDLKELQNQINKCKELKNENELAKKSLIENSNVADERNDLLVEVQKLRTFKQDVKETVDEYSNNNPKHHIFEIDDCINITQDILLLLDGSN